MTTSYIGLPNHSLPMHYRPTKLPSKYTYIEINSGLNRYLCQTLSKTWVSTALINSNLAAGLGSSRTLRRLLRLLPVLVLLDFILEGHEMGGLRKDSVKGGNGKEENDKYRPILSKKLLFGDVNTKSH